MSRKYNNHQGGVLSKTGILTLMVLMVLLFSFGCSSAEGAFHKAEEAVTAQNYDQAARYARRALLSSYRQEANMIIEYSKYGDNMLHAAFWEEDLEALKYLAGIIYDINATEDRFNSPVLVLAAAWGHYEVVKVLLEAGADPNYGADKDGYTALMWAAKNFEEQLEMVRVLLEAGAEVNVKSKHGETALKIAEQYLNPNIAALLKKHSADIENVTSYKKAVGEGDWVYYPNWEDDYKVYGLKSYGSSTTKINDDRSRHLNIAGDWIYYENIDDEGRIYRIKTDGSGREKISGYRSWGLSVSGDWIFFENIDDGDKIYRINLDGTGYQKINDDRSWHIIIEDGWIYYQNFDDSSGPGYSFYRIKTDGSGREKIIDDSAGQIIVDGDWIYYIVFDFDDIDNHQRIYKVKTDGSDLKRIGQDWSSHISLSEDKIYYVIGSEGENIYRIATDGSLREAVNEDRTGYFDVVGEWIYYLNRDDGYRIYRIRTDGTGYEAVD